MISMGKRPSGHVYSFHILLKINELLNLGDGFLFGRKNPTAPDEIDGLCTNIKGCPEGHSSFGSGFPIGASSIPVGTRLSLGKSSVLYLCGADGSRNCSTPRKVWLQLRRSGGKGCPLRGSISDRKRLAGGADMYCLPALSSAEQRYIKAPSAAAYHPCQNHHGSFPRRLSIASPSTFFVRLSLRWKWSAAPISGCSIPSVKP